MSISIQSETSKDEIETEDAELEDLVWNLMSRTGLLSQIQGQISKFIEDNGKSENITIQPDRADGRILGFIFEYLQWIGMKQTNTVLLSESPVEVDMTVYESRMEDSDYKPEICKLFEEHNNGTEDKASPTRSQNYSKDEFEDSRLTSASGHQSIKSDNSVEDEASSNENESEEDKSYSSHKQSRRRSIPLENEAEKKVETVEGARDQSKDDMISFSSPAKSVRDIDEIRPNVTVRHRFEPDTTSDPFQSPIAVKEARNPFEAVPTVDRNNRLSFVQASNAFDDFFGDDKSVGKDNPVFETNSHHSTSSKGQEVGKQTEEKSKILSQHESYKQSPNIEKNPEPKNTLPLSQEEDDSTSDLMETLTMEDDTQDASIDSNTKGMSSCEHAVNLK